MTGGPADDPLWDAVGGGLAPPAPESAVGAVEASTFEGSSYI